LIGVSVVGLARCIALGSIDRTDTFSLANAEPVDPRLLDTLAAKLEEAFFHRQTFGLPFIAFELQSKVTVWLPSAPNGAGAGLRPGP
jgi:hypothetical protein